MDLVPLPERYYVVILIIYYIKVLKVKTYALYMDGFKKYHGVKKLWLFFPLPL
jgi:hypothetical protein